MSPPTIYRSAIALTLLLTMSIGSADGRCLAQEIKPGEIIQEQEAARPQEAIQPGVVVDFQIVEGPSEGPADDAAVQAVEVLDEAEAAVMMGGLMGGEFALDDGDPLFIVLSRHAHAEAGLARRACNLSHEQLVALKQLDAQWIRDQLAKKELGGGNVNILRGIGRFLGGGVIAEPPIQPQSASHKRVTKLMDEHIQAILNEEQRQTFNTEREARDAFYREATAEVLVAVYDKHVLVKKEQREQLVADIAQWATSKSLYWQFYFQNDAYVPNVPNSLLAKTLDEKQLKSLKGLNPYSYDMDEVQMQMNGMRHGIEFVDE